MSEKNEKLTLNRETVDILVANVIPTTKYFELRFDTMQDQINRIEKQNDKLRIDMDNKFDAMRNDVDKRFEQVDKRFEQVISSIDRLTDVLEGRDREQRSFTLKMFMISISISVLGVLGVILKIAGVFS